MLSNVHDVSNGKKWSPSCLKCCPSVVPLVPKVVPSGLPPIMLPRSHKMCEWVPLIWLQWLECLYKSCCWTDAIWKRAPGGANKQWGNNSSKMYPYDSKSEVFDMFTLILHFLQCPGKHHYDKWMTPLTKCLSLLVSFSSTSAFLMHFTRMNNSSWKYTDLAKSSSNGLVKD